MTDKDFQILKALSSEGLSPSEYDFAEDIRSTKKYFGTITDIRLKGKYLAVWRKKGESDVLGIDTFTCKEPFGIMSLADSDNRILLFKFDN